MMRCYARRTSDRALPVIIKLVFHKPQHETRCAKPSVYCSFTRAEASIQYLDFPTADSPEKETSEWNP